MTEITSGVAHAAVQGVQYGTNFERLADSVRRTWANATAAYGGKVFRVTPKLAADNNMNNCYLSGFVNPDERQHHTCSACASFLKKFGHLAVITDDGSIRSALWDSNDRSIPEEYRLAVTQLATAVRQGKVQSVFYSSAPNLDASDAGTMTGADEAGFTHFTVPRGTVGSFTDLLKSPGQMMADSQNHYFTFTRALAENDRATIARAVTLLSNGGLPSASTVLPAARWMLQVHDTLASHGTAFGNRGERGNNILWREIHHKPAGWLTLRSGLLGSLLDDIKAGKSDTSIRRSFGEKVEPTQYRRAQVAPRVGNVAAGEAIVARLGLAPSFERRYADVNECELLWQPAARRIPGGPVASSGIFSGLPTHQGVTSASIAPPRDRTAELITWARFQRTVLPEAQAIWAKLEPVSDMIAILTAVHPLAPAIIAWDNPVEGAVRNPFSWYTYAQGSRTSQWGVRSGEWLPVQGIGLLPCGWSTAVGYSGNRFAQIALAYIEGAYESMITGLGLFDELLRSELHQIRATLEAYSQRGVLANRQPGNACGIQLGQNGRLHTLRVKTSTGYSFYKVDRWD